MKMLGWVLIAMLLAACGDSDNNDAEPGTDTGADTTDAGDDAADAANNGIDDTGDDAGDDAEPDVPDGPYMSENYKDLEKWVCHPDKDDICDESLDVTSVTEDGTPTLEPFEAAADPGIDCFYVYPTVSLDGTPNSDWMATVEEPFVTQNQAARLQSFCRLYAPIYRQVTVTALFGGDENADRELAYADAADAFKHYLANDNDGRGFLLIGHSQGTGVLTRLVQEEIQPNPELAERMVAAWLIGLTIAVPDGESVGGTFSNIPVCADADSTGCVVSYATYRATDPPDPATALFGRTGDPATRAVCVTPMELLGEGPALEAYFPTDVPGALATFFEAEGGPFADPDSADPIETPLYAMPGLLEGRCKDEGAFSYMEAIILADEEDARADDIAGDLSPGWGLHLVDMNVAMGNLQRLGARQAAAYLAR
jgi:hypothetical protein